MQILDTLADGRQLIRLQTPLAALILPGQKIVDAEQCFPVLRHDANAQTIDLVVSAVNAPAVQTLALTGVPIHFSLETSQRFICHNDGIFIALHFLFNQASALRSRVSVIAQFDGALPFRPCPSRFYSANLPAQVIAAIPLLEDWGVFNRIVHRDAPGCYDGSVDDLRALFPASDAEVILD